ncbi:MAG: protease complex subunit PrcB family protein [Candidatus Thorarchaeota archaeon]|jgi:hypothetical protein
MRIANREIAAIVLCLTIIGASVVVVVFPNLNSIPFEILDLGGFCGITARVEYKITEEQDWETLWKDMNNISSLVPELPPVNFTTDTLIAVFQGERATGGYLTTITRIVLTGTNYVVYVDEEHPGSGVGVLMVYTQPFHIVKISGYPKHLPVAFVYNVFAAK